jgi:hypothetical protein
MKRTVTVVAALVALTLAGLTTSAPAAPSLAGYTGLLLVPTADALDREEYNAAFFTLNLEEGADESIFAANLGVSEGVEVGFARIRPEDEASETILNAKYRFRSEDGARPALAVGVTDATDEMDTSVYVVASRSISKLLQLRDDESAGARLHVGLGGGGQLDGLFAGLSGKLGDRLTLMAEYDTRDINLGARLAVGHGLRLHAGWIHGLDDLAIGASFSQAL